ncbi:MAG TPA: hypothetical protein VEW95_09515 [Candidatus Limnocylindrales bacterium]|nr:hypothetical protein [Candidatus Limnocylindrales bacterium]
MLVVEQPTIFGIPQTAVTGWAPRGAAWHWSGGGEGRVGWDGTVRHLIATRATVNASYHGGFWHEHAADARCRTVIQWVVPTSKAAHSIAPSQVFQLNPDKPTALQQARFAIVRAILARDNDPNADCLAVAFAGMPAGLERALACPVFRADVQQLARSLVAHPTVVDRPHFGHGWIQPITRYEMDVATDFISLLYGASAPTSQEDDMPVIKPVEQRWMTGVGDTLASSAATSVAPGGQFWTAGPGAGDRKFFTVAEEVRSVGESADGQWRLIPYGAEYVWMHRNNLRPVDGTRRPAAGFGLPETTTIVKEVPTGITLEQLQQAFFTGRDKAAAAAKEVQP